MQSEVEDVSDNASLFSTGHLVAIGLCCWSKHNIIGVISKALIWDASRCSRTTNALELAKLTGFKVRASSTFFLDMFLVLFLDMCQV